jgi:hypothetical protein
METETPSIFISYSHRDTEFAEKLDDHLTKAGFVTWRDKIRIDPGDDWSDSINGALQTCQIMILIHSPDAVASDQVKKEWKYFIDKKKTLIPVLYRNTESRHYLLHDIEYVSFLDQKFQTAFDKLSSAIQKELQKSQSQEAQNINPQVSSQNHSPTRANRKILYVVIAFLLLIGVIAVAINSIPRQSGLTLSAPTSTSVSDSESLTPTVETVSLFEFIYESDNVIRYTRLSNSSEVSPDYVYASPLEHLTQPIWSPNGLQVAATGMKTDETLARNQISLLTFSIQDQLIDQQVIYRAEEPINCINWTSNSELTFTQLNDSSVQLFQLSLISGSLVKVAEWEDAVFESCPSFGYLNIAYSARRDGDADIFMFNPTSNAEIQLTINDVDDLMPAMGGKRPTLAYFQATSDPEVYQLITQSIMNIPFDNIERVEGSYVPSTEVEVLFSTRRLSRLTWGVGGNYIAFGYEAPEGRVGGLAWYCFINCQPAGNGPITLASSMYSANNPSWRPPRR